MNDYRWDFTSDVLNTKWCGNITYIPAGSTWASGHGNRHLFAPGRGMVDRRPHAHPNSSRKRSTWMSCCNRRRRHSAPGYLAPASSQQLIASHTFSLAT